MTIQRLNEVIGDNLIFTTLMDTYTLPWASDTTITATLLDFEYLYNHSGRKVISPAVEVSLDDDDEIDSTAFVKLCDIAYMMYNKKWTRNWTVLTADYNPIENYNMTETEETTRDNKETHSGNDTLSMTGTDTNTHTGTDTFTHTGTDTNVKSGSETDAHTGTVEDDGDSTSENNVSAFNSSSYQDSDKNTGTNDNTRTYGDTITSTYNSVTDAETKNLTDTETKNLTDTDTRNMTDTTTHGHVIDNDDDETRELTRSGNIGVTTSQQMLQSDIELWKWNFFYEVFHDIDTVFTISTY